ncbi:MAG: hypothetical protein J0M19_13130 [Sphingomonadales bacterium]|nr:hypothetical protein [Sphingomonadales bacterium]
MRIAARWIAGLSAVSLLTMAATTAIARIRSFPPVPAGWKVDDSATGDLNGDGVGDVALVLRKDDPKLVLRNEGMGSETLDTNPRRLVIFFRQGTAFRQVASSSRLLPPAGSKDSPCLADPLGEGGISIAQQVLTLSMDYWLSCGGWGTSTNTYKFKREGARFRLIGFDHREFMRNSGKGEEVSVNFLSNRKSQTPFAIDDSIPKKLRWSRIKPQRHYLDSLDLEACPQVDRTTTLC